MRPIFSHRQQLWIAVGVAAAMALLLAIEALRGAEPAVKRATARRLGNAIDLYLKEVDAAEKAKVAAAEKLVATYEATIKRAMRAGELKVVEELQAELREVKAELEKTDMIGGGADGGQQFKQHLLTHRWFLYWDTARNMQFPFRFKDDGSVRHENVAGTAGWSKSGWKIERRWVVICQEAVLLLTPCGELRGFFEGADGMGRPVGAFLDRSSEPSPRQK